MNDKMKTKIAEIVHSAVWQSMGCDPFMRCIGCGCYDNSPEHWDEDCPYAELSRIVEKAIGD